MPLFSVIIPCYNRSEMISDTISSVLNQTERDFELILVDDGSTDDTKDVIKKWIEKDNRILLVEQANSERGKARNHGWKCANGEWICFLDSDDLMLADHLKTIKEAIIQHPNVGLFASKYSFVENGKKYASPMSRLNEGMYSYKALIKGNPFACNITIKNNHPENITFREERVFSSMEDWIFLFSNLWSRELFLIGKNTLEMREHENRSMRNHVMVTEKRILSMNYIISHFSLTREERNTLSGYSHYFCGIHYYLDEKRIKALGSLLTTMRFLGFKKDILKLFIKIIIGRKVTLRIKDILFTESK